MPPLVWHDVVLLVLFYVGCNLFGYGFGLGYYFKKLTNHEDRAIHERKPGELGIRRVAIAVLSVANIFPIIFVACVYLLLRDFVRWLQLDKLHRLQNYLFSRGDE